MNILVPFSNVDQMEALIKAGATELFCGYVPDEWIESIHSDPDIFATLVSINKRSFVHANLRKEEDLRNVVRMAKEYNVRLFLTLNAICYSEPVWDLLKRYICRIEELGVESVIVSDIAVMRYVTEHTRMKISVSCLNNVINDSMIRFYKQFNVDRIVFPRHISVDVMKELCLNHPDLEFEYFILSDKCIYDDGNCHCVHIIGAFCTDSWNSDYFRMSGDDIDEKELKMLIENESTFDNWAKCHCTGNTLKRRWSNIGCSLCSLVDVIKIPNMVSLKLVGRGLSIADLSFLLDTTQKSVELAGSSDVARIREFARETFNNDDMCNDFQYCIVRGGENE